ncbi:flavin reductase family protein [Geodermatophilus sp. SYSU D00710]
MPRTATSEGTGEGTGVDAGAFRRILGRFPTGVVVVSASVGGRPVGMAVNSFTSVSLEPPLVCFCAAHSSTTWPDLRRAGGCTVSILASGHEDLARLFARRGADRYGDRDAWTTSPGGHPLLADALGWLDCATVAVHPAGDHDLVLGRVVDGGAADGDPLVFAAGRFTTVRG